MFTQLYCAPGQTVGRKKAFLEWASIDLSLNYLFHARVILTIIKVFIIRFLLCLWEYGTPCQFSKQISKIAFHLSVQIYYLLTQAKEEKKAFFGGCIVIFPPRALCCHKRWKSLSFCEIWNRPTSSLLVIRPPYKQALEDMEIYDKLVDRLQDLSKVAGQRTC